MLEHLAAKLDVLAELARKDILVVAGVPKSGTTWVQRMLDSHPEIYCPGEGKFGVFLEDFLKAVTRYNASLDLTNRLIYGPDAYYRAWGEENVRAAFQCVMALSWAASRHKDLALVRYLGDKDTIYAEAIGAWRDGLLKGARFIHVVRDGRDTAVSYVFHHQRLLNRPARFDTPDFHTFLGGYAANWAQSVAVYRGAFKDHPDLYHEVRYEDMLAEPAARLRAMLAFLGVASDPELVAGIVDRNRFEKLTGGRKAGREDTASFLRKGTAGDWREHFDAQARKVFNERAGTTLAALGYDLE